MSVVSARRWTTQGLLLISLSPSLFLGACDSRNPYLPAKDKAGRELRWSVEVVRFEVVAARRGRVSATRLEEVASRAAKSWRAVGVPRIEVARATAARAVREDGVNVIALREDRWCPSDLPENCYSKEQAGFTRPYMTAKSRALAEVVEADIEINGVDFHFDETDDSIARLQALLAHEFGHVLGLDHDCRSVESSHARDVQGAQLPRCDEELALRSVMHPSPLLPGRALVAQPNTGQLAALAEQYRSSRARVKR